MGFHGMPECPDERPRCNNKNEYGRCVALSEASSPCSFYCSIKDTNSEDYEYHIKGLRKMVEKEIRLVGEIL